MIVTLRGTEADECTPLLLRVDGDVYPVREVQNRKEDLTKGVPLEICTLLAWTSIHA